MISAGESLGMSARRGRIAGLVHQILVGQQAFVGGVAGHHDGAQHRCDTADGSGHRGQHRLGDQQPGLAVLDQEGDLGRCEPEIDGHGDGPDHVGGQYRLDELGSVQHQDHHPVAVADPAATQGSGELADPVAKLGPGDGRCP